MSENERWSPQEGPQLDACLATWCQELLFGGAAGGGKTDFLLGDWAQGASEYGSAWNGILFRRNFTEFNQIIRRSQLIFPAMFPGARYRETDHIWKTAEGAELRLAHMERDSQVAKYMGESFTWIGWDELTHWGSDVPYCMMLSRLRSAENVPEKRIRATANPGFAGHQWVKRRFAVDTYPHGYEPFQDPETGMTRMFIPSKLSDNVILERSDPQYRKRMRGLGSADRVKAMLEGDWTIVAGGFFDDIWNPERHILRPFPIPGTWRRRRSFDWGIEKPSCLQFWAESDGSPVPELGGRVFPRGSLILYREWYTVKRDKNGHAEPNKGLRLSNNDLGAGIALRSAGETFSGCVADPSIFTESGGKSIYQQMLDGARKIGKSFSFRAADNSRVPGWQLVRTMLEQAGKERPESPGLWVFQNCTEFIRTVPVLPRSERNPEDIDTEAEDHSGDSLRYACMTTGIRVTSGRVGW